MKFQIELRVDFQDSEKYPAMQELARQAACELLATALLLKDKRDPQIMFFVGDMFTKEEIMEIITPDMIMTPEREAEVTSDGNWS